MKWPMSTWIATVALMVSLIGGLGGGLASYVTMRVELEHLEEEHREHESRGGHEQLQREVDILKARLQAFEQRAETRERTLNHRLSRIEEDIAQMRSDLLNILRALQPSE